MMWSTRLTLTPSAVYPLLFISYCFCNLSVCRRQQSNPFYKKLNNVYLSLGRVPMTARKKLCSSKRPELQSPSPDYSNPQSGTEPALPCVMHLIGAVLSLLALLIQGNAQGKPLKHTADKYVLSSRTCMLRGVRMAVCVGHGCCCAGRVIQHA